ncbi:MAG: glycosyltransferase family 1 protein [Chitinophagia bacterium]|nr:glycosyltransferase family 1 protein [Chitinophagia bacterium]
MRVIHVVRRRDPRFFSIESVFEIVRGAWKSGVRPEVWMLPRSGVSPWNLLYLFRKALSAPRDTVFHVTGDALYAVFALPRGRTTLTVHDCVFLHRRKGIKRWLLLKLTLDWPLRWCLLSTVISEQTRSEVVKFTGFDAERLVVIPNPVSPLIKHVSKPFPVAMPRLLFFGITPNKNLLCTIKALEGLDVHLSIVGRPGPEILAQLQASGLSHDLSHGLTDEEVALKYTESDIVLFPSLYEGFGLPIIEGFGSGRPVITSDRLPMSDVAGDAACLVDPEDLRSIRQGVVRLCTDSDYREGLVQKGLERVNMYQPERIASEYASVYGRLMKSKT